MNIKHFSSCITVGILICISVFSMSGCGKRADWEKVTIINHACGGIDGNSYTNSTEALDNSIKSNCESVEIDFRYTSDGTLICAHDWEDIGFKSAPTLEELLASGDYEEGDQSQIQRLHDRRGLADVALDDYSDVQYHDDRYRRALENVDGAQADRRVLALRDCQVRSPHCGLKRLR